MDLVETYLSKDFTDYTVALHSRHEQIFSIRLNKNNGFEILLLCFY